MRSDYHRWLESQDYSANSVIARFSHAGRAEKAYGDLDQHFADDRLEGVLASLLYSTEHKRRNRPNPSKVVIDGDLYNGLASLKSAVGLYRRFLDQTGPGSSTPTAALVSPIAIPDGETRERIGLERDLQKALRREIAQLEPCLVIIDDGVERAVASGYIDITARDATGTIVVIELKAGVADRSAVSQIQSYMGDLIEEEAGTDIRGILVAHDFDGKAKAAARPVPTLALRTYSVRFSFGEPASPSA